MLTVSTHDHVHSVPSIRGHKLSIRCRPRKLLFENKHFNTMYRKIPAYNDPGHIRAWVFDAMRKLLSPYINNLSCRSLFPSLVARAPRWSHTFDDPEIAAEKQLESRTLLDWAGTYASCIARNFACESSVASRSSSALSSPSVHPFLSHKFHSTDRIASDSCDLRSITESSFSFQFVLPT